MSKFRSLLASLTVTVMITDLVLVALACVPEAMSHAASETNAAVSAAVGGTSQALLARGGGGNLVEPASWGSFWKRVKACIKCGGNYALSGFGLVKNPGQSASCRRCRGENQS
jgi:hypothetical protein